MLAMVLAIVAAIFSEIASHGRFTFLGVVLAIVIAVVAIGASLAVGGVAWSQRPDEFWIRIASEAHYRYAQWTTLGVWLVGSWAVLCVVIVATSGVIAGRLCRLVLRA
jgi:lysylphosphatidylglycerol synthetase-like protein (DUF2156 family)